MLRNSFQIVARSACVRYNITTRPVVSLPTRSKFQQITTRFRSDSSDSKSSESSASGHTDATSNEAEAPSAEKGATEGDAPLAETDSTSKLAEKDLQIAHLTDLYRRSLADAENLRQRTRKEVENSKEFAIQKFAKELLDTADVLQMALQAVPAKDRIDEAGQPVLHSLYNGVDLTRSNLLKVFGRFGVTPYDPIDEIFDPNLHQALFQSVIEGKQPGTIFNVAKTGYMIGNRVLRPAQVGVVKDEE